MSTCVYPPIEQSSQTTSEKKPEFDFSKLRDTIDKCFVDSVSQSAQIPQFDTYGREWCLVCQEYLCAGHLHKGSPEYNEMNEKAREMGMCFDGLQRHAVNPNYNQVNPEIHLSPDYIRDSLQVLKADVKYLADEIKKLFRWVNDLSELRHETNQNKGCIRDKVENDLMPQVAMLWEDGAKLRKNFKSLCEHMGSRTADFEIKDCEFHKRLEKIESWSNKPSPWALDKDVCNLRREIQHKDADLWERVKKLESENLQRQDTIGCMDSAYDESHRSIEKRLTELERFQDITHKQYQKVITGKVPHKCPVCEGMGGFLSTEPNICHACDGKGIVWG